MNDCILALHIEFPQIPTFKYALSKAAPEVFCKETPTQMFSCQYYEFFKNAYFEEYLQTNCFYIISCPCTLFLDLARLQIYLQFDKDETL